MMNERVRIAIGAGVIILLLLISAGYFATL